jgi:hypothetical protein
MIAFIRACGAVSTTRMPSVVNTPIEQAGELAVPVPDQESEVVGLIAKAGHQVAGLLRDPASCRVRRDTQHVDTACSVFDHHEAVQPGGSDRFHAEEVAGHEPGRLDFKKLAPGLVTAPGCWTEPGLRHDGPDGGRGGLPAQTGDLAGYAPVSPGRVPGRQPQDLATDRRPDRWSSRLALGVGPASLHQVSVPPQERPRRDDQVLSAAPGE